MGALVDLAHCPDPHYLKSLVIQLPAVIVPHVSILPERKIKVGLLLNSLVSPETRCLSPVTSRHRRLLLLDSRENAVPEKNPRLQRSIDGGAAFLPTAVVVTAQLCQHLHRHGSVLFAVHLDMAGQVITKDVEAFLIRADGNDLVEHIRDEILAPEGKCRRLAVHRRVLYKVPGGSYEIGRRLGRGDRIERRRDTPAISQAG